MPAWPLTSMNSTLSQLQIKPVRTTANSWCWLGTRNDRQALKHFTLALMSAVVLCLGDLIQFRTLGCAATEFFRLSSFPIFRAARQRRPRPL